MASLRQFDRAVRLTIVPPEGGTIVVNPKPPAGYGPTAPQVHVRFAVSKSTGSEPNRGSVELFNLGPVNRRRISSTIRRTATALESATELALAKIDARLAEPDPTQVTVRARQSYCRLEAGYGTGLSQLIEGQGAQIRSRRRGPTWSTTIEIGDSELQLTQAQCNKGFELNTPASVVVAYIATTLGLRLMKTSKVAELGDFGLSNGYAVVGRARDALTDMLSIFVDDNAAPPDWWVDDGELWITGRGEPLPGPPLVMAPTAVPGALQLLDSPEPLDEGGVATRTLLHPGIRPGFTAQIVGSSEAAGTYRIESVSHSGDNRGGAFESRAILRRPLAVSF
jgi:hypothetical protein